MRVEKPIKPDELEKGDCGSRQVHEVVNLFYKVLYVHRYIFGGMRKIFLKLFSKRELSEQQEIIRGYLKIGTIQRYPLNSKILKQKLRGRTKI